MKQVRLPPVPKAVAVGGRAPPAKRSLPAWGSLALRDRVTLWAGVGFGSGLMPKAPGTFGSLAALALVPLWNVIGLAPSLAVIAVMSGVGIYICGRSAALMRVHDDGRIVWDEFAGQSLAVMPWLWLEGHISWTGALVGFGLFRLFDVWKPWPVRWADRRLHGGFGIMVDDILAGLLAALVAWGSLMLWPRFSG